MIRVGARAVAFLTLTAACEPETSLPLSESAPSLRHAARLEHYEPVDLGTLGGSFITPNDLDDRDRVVGTAELPDGRQAAFIWADGVLQALPPAPQNHPWTRADRIHESGLIGGAENDTHGFVLLWDSPSAQPITVNHRRHPEDFHSPRVMGLNRRGDVLITVDAGPNQIALVLRNGELLQLPNLEAPRPGFTLGPYTIGLKITERGIVVGNSRAYTDGPNVHFHGFVWEDGVMRDLGVLSQQPCNFTTTDSLCADSYAVDINRHGVIVGSSDAPYPPPANQRAVRWIDGEIEELDAFPGWRTGAGPINKRGQIVGGYSNGSGITGVFLWEEGVTTDIGSLGGGRTNVRGFNDRSEIVGSSRTASGEEHAYVWASGTMLDLGPGRAVNVNARGSVLVVTPEGRVVLYRRVDDDDYDDEDDGDDDDDDESEGP